MESNMVESLEPKYCVKLVEDFFSKNIKGYTLNKETTYTGYWWLEYINQSDVKICFDGDIGGHFSIKIFIGDTEFNLWQFDRSVNYATKSTEENIFYQLNVLSKFLNETT